MKPASPEQVLFAEALQCATDEGRAVYLDAACGTDTALRRRVGALLCAAENAGDFLEQPPTGLSGNDESTSLAGEVTEMPGVRIGRYKLLEKIGEGGCGTVYMADQEEPVRRRVALKIIKLGMDTRSVVGRFEAERQALALMDHPNIAKVFDGGATQTGRPYFVMELVRGVRITEFCDEARLSMEARLRLFVQVCQAIQHAHQKGIIHRDLKPSNILVTVNDGAAVPKVIDFGIAKATGQRLTDKTLFTQFHSFMGTPAYTSPEQAEMSSVDVDTRSDIYSLGVLLYELLTGKTPFDGEELLRSGLDEMRRVIREVEPIKPSTRLTRERSKRMRALAGQAPALGFHSARSAIDSDLDSIVLKCLQKDRARRYDTANDLAADIQRHLNHEPIQARPVSSFGRFWRWRRRHPAVAFLSVSVLLLLAVVAIGSTVAAWRVTSARLAEQEERTKAEAANRELQGANRQLADTVNELKLRRAEDLFAANDSSAGVAHLAAILRHNPSDHVAASRLVSALVHRDWALPGIPPIRHADRVATVSFAPDGRRVLSASWDKTAQVHDALTGALLVTVRHDDAVLMACYDREGHRLLTASADGTARIWSATNGAPLTPPMRHKANVLRAEFSSDERSILTTADERYVRLWDAASGELRREWRAHSVETMCAAFSLDGTRILTGSRWGSIRLWSVESGHNLLQLDAHILGIHAFALSPDGRRFASAGSDGNALLWDLATGQRIGASMPHRDVVRHVAFSPDGTQLLSVSQDYGAQLWNATNGTSVGPPMRHEGGVVFGAFSPDGQMIVTTTMDNSARLWDARTSRPLCQPLRQAEAILHAGFSPDGRKLVTGSWDGTVQVWNIQPRRFAGIETRMERDVVAVAFHPRSESVASAHIDHVARIWDARTGQPLGQPMRHPGRVESIHYSPDGRQLVTACSDGAAYVWDSATGLQTGVSLQHSNTVWLARFSPDGERIITASEDGTARLWDARTGKTDTPLLEHGAAVRFATFSPDGRLVATGAADGSARVWDARDGRPVTDRLRHLDDVEWVAFSPDGQRLISASKDNTARLWDVRTGQPIGAVLRHARTVQRAAFSPDGRRVATASLDRTARVWDASTGEALTGSMLHEKSVTQVAFSADGQRLLTSSGLTSAWRLWDAATGRPLTEYLAGSGPHSETACLDSTGLRVLTGSMDGSVRVMDAPPVPAPVPAWFLKFVEGVAGMRLSARGDAELVPRPELEEATQQLRRMTENGFYEHLGRWFLADPTERSASPF